MEQYYLPLLLTTLGGLATALGGISALFFSNVKRKQLSIIMGFAAGVMLYISFAELLEESIDFTGFIAGNTAFFLGIFSMMLIDHLIPHTYLAEKIIHSSKKNNRENISQDESNDKKEVLSAGLMTAIGIVLHNFPEGVVVFLSSLHDIRLGIALTIAIALHNIPEGFSIGMPIFYATNDKKKTFIYSLAAGFAEPIGAIILMLFMARLLTPHIVHLSLGFVAGIMVFISLDELLPLSFKTDHSHGVTLGIITGMLAMFITLIFVF